MGSLLDGVARVLSSEGRALKAGAITEKLIEAGLWTSSGKTPAATVEARLAVDIKKLGEGSRFIRTAPGSFALRDGGTPAPIPTRSVVPETSPGPNGGSALSFTDAAARVLRHFAGNQPMHYRDVTKKALENGWLVTAGQTPEATLYSQVYTEIERRKTKGLQPRFYRLKKGLIGLTDWLPKGLAREIEDQNRTVKKQLRERLLALSAGDFEALVGQLLAKMGFEDVVVTNIAKDGGIDARAVLVVGEAIRIRMAVQAKKWSANVQAPVVQNVRGSLGVHDHGLIVTTSDFSPGAKAEASLPDRAPVALMNGFQLVDLLVSYEIGVDRAPYDLLTLSSLTLPGED